MEYNFISDIYLVDFYEKKFNKGLYSIEQLILDHKECWKGKGYNNYHTKSLQRELKKSEKLNERCDTPFYKILQVGNGKISICGVAINSMFADRSKDFCDVYFHSCTILEANDLLHRCITILSGGYMETIYYSKETACVIFAQPYISYRIHLEVYKNRNEILRNNGPAPERHGYDLEVGYFCTTSAAILLFKRFGLFEEDPRDLIPNNRRNIHGFHDINTNIIPGVTEIFGELYSLDPNDEDLIYCSKIGQHYNVLTVMDPTGLSNIRTKLFVPKPFTKINYKEYFGEGYESINVGLSDDRFTAFYHCKIMYNISNDVFWLLCDFWLELETMEAKKRLLLSH